jgi:hypothetical protein
MRRSLLAAAALVLAAVPAWAQSSASPLGKHTIPPGLILCADTPVTSIPVATLVVSGGHNADGRQSLVKGDAVVLGSGTNAGVAVGQRFVARRLKGTARSFPKVGFGAVLTGGLLTVTAVNEQTAMATIDYSCAPIEPGDYLEPYVEHTLPTRADDMAALQFDDRASILFGSTGRETFADGDVFSIDRGTGDGVMPGARFAIYRDGHNGLPLVHLGEAVVVEPLERTSKLILVSVIDAVTTGDVAIRRRQP